MTGKRFVLALALTLAGTAAASTELDAVRAEANLEKRSKLALDNAASALRSAREAYQAGDTATVTAKTDEIGESVDLAYNSLTETGKNPRKSPKWFKHAEMETRELTRRLEDFAQQMNYNDRAILDKIRARVEQVHDELLTGLMEGRKKK
ncbi:MAG: hypothetical protein KGM92_10675 [Acidobacteriota bacterium]|jgi:uncharacterized protein (DUF1800 family)|nr:hypothetical protein [Acidobacteriota bacterium]